MIINKITKHTKTFLMVVSAIVISFSMSSCDFEYDLPEAGSIADATPPSAAFTYSQGIGLENDEWKTYTFSNQSSSATGYSWDFGNGNTSTEVDPENTYSGEGTWTVTLTASDDLGVVSVYSEEITVVEPEAPATPDPVLVNVDFDKIPKSSGSDCSCSGWINKSIGDQGESSSGNGSDVLKWDNNEPDAIYQEFEVVPNADYLISIVTQFKPLEGVTGMPSSLELRVLAGSGYVDGYTPTYYTDTAVMPQDDWGYTSVAQAEDPANNLYVTVQDNPGDDSYLTYTYVFNSGANDSVALYVRGIGGPASGGGGSDLGFNSGEEEIRADYLYVTAIND